MMSEREGLEKASFSSPSRSPLKDQKGSAKHKEAEALSCRASTPVPFIHEPAFPISRLPFRMRIGMTPIAIHKFPANQRRHYEGMSRFPEGLVILGDALCSFNPIYGQGMTTALLEASLLNEWLRKLRGFHRRGKVTGLARPLQKALAKVVDVPWLVATSEDFRYPETEGHRPPGIRLLHWYTGRMHELAGSNSRATLGFYEVLHMRKSPMALFTPLILFAVLFKGQRPGGSYDQPTEIDLRTGGSRQ
jgi:hypothetical protein